ncbi:MAG TPA: hypothetical protein VFS51_01520 [Gemmatimonadales bacterium]|nr:hypothetical protein [Gemmatimonadales bacterium]
MQNPVTSGAPSGAADTTRFDLLELIARVQAWHWIAASVLILLVDYMTGPFIQFPILFVVPVAIATAAQGVMAGSIVAVLLPLLRLSFFLKWELPSSWLLEGVDTGVDVAILVGFAALLHRTLLQRRQIRVLEGMLPICSFCKRIRDEKGQWRQLEAYITERSDALFSHTFCEQCSRTHYPGTVD